MEFKEPREGDSNNEYPGEFNKREGLAGDKSDGMGLERGGDGLNDFAGSVAGERDEYLKREVRRFEELRSKAFGRTTPITNAGIVLDSFGGSFGEESGSKGGSVGEQKGE